jgi:hypothetical protein
MGIFDGLRKKYSTHVWKTVHGDYEFFQAAILKLVDTHDLVIAIAALAAAKRATREQRRNCVEFMVRVVYPHCDNETVVLLDSLRHDIEAKDWTIRDAAAEERRLSEIDKELAHALSKHDSDVFRRRYPEPFPTDD